MAKLPVLKRILREDLKEAPDWIERLLYPINTFFDAVFQALKKNITFDENIACQLRDVNFRTTSAYDGTAANWTTVSFVKTIKTKAIGVWILDIKEVADNYTPIEGATSIDWLEFEDQIEIHLVQGLKVSTSYNMKVIVI
jgi:hypothetical protein